MNLKITDVVTTKQPKGLVLKRSEAAKYVFIQKKKKKHFFLFQRKNKQHADPTILTWKIIHFLMEIDKTKTKIRNI